MKDVALWVPGLEEIQNGIAEILGVRVLMRFQAQRRDLTIPGLTTPVEDAQNLHRVLVGQKWAPGPLTHASGRFFRKNIQPDAEKVLAKASPVGLALHDAPTGGQNEGSRGPSLIGKHAGLSVPKHRLTVVSKLGGNVATHRRDEQRVGIAKRPAQSLGAQPPYLALA